VTDKIDLLHATNVDVHGLPPAQLTGCLPRLVTNLGGCLTQTCMPENDYQTSQWCVHKLNSQQLLCYSYLRLKFSTTSEAAKAMELLKEYKRDGQELTIKFFAEDDSEGNAYSFAVKIMLMSLPYFFCNNY